MSVSNQMYSSTIGLNPLKNVLVTEGEKLVRKIIHLKIKIQIGGARLCEELWEEMRRADFRKEGILNEANIQIIYENKKKLIDNLLKINSVKEFLLVFDDDQDGFLNEDEQTAKKVFLCKDFSLYENIIRNIWSDLEIVYV